MYEAIPFAAFEALVLEDSRLPVPLSAEGAFGEDFAGSTAMLLDVVVRSQTRLLDAVLLGKVDENEVDARLLVADGTGACTESAGNALLLVDAKAPVTADSVGIRTAAAPVRATGGSQTPLTCTLQVDH